MSNPAAPLVPLSLLPPGIKDARQEALTRVLGDALSEIDIASLVMSDPLTVDAKLLPFMIREFSAQDYIDPELPEHVQRRILKNIWALQALKGYDAGVKLGLELLGMNGVVEHWHQVEPKRPANTHTIIFYVGEQLFPNEQTFFGAREIRAAKRMIDVTKRWSQESTIYKGVAVRLRPIRTAQRLRCLRVLKARMRVMQMPPRLPMAQTQTTRLSVTSVQRNRVHVGQQPPKPQIISGLSQSTRALSVKRLRLASS